MKWSVPVLCLLILVGAHHAAAQNSSANATDLVLVPVRHNPVVIEGVGQECPSEEVLQATLSEVEAETDALLDSVVDQIECTYLGNC